MKVIRPTAITSAALTTNAPEQAPDAYSSATTYAADSVVSVTTSGVSKVYRSLQAANTAHTPASSPTWWQYVADTYAEYSVYTSYALNTVVIDALGDSPTHHAYQSLVGSNLGNALSDATKWLDLGPTNRWAMFDQSNGTPTTSSDNLDVTVQMTGRADGLGLFGLSAESVQVTVSTAADGTIYDQTYSLVSDSGIDDFYEYCFEPISYQTDLVLTDIPIYDSPSFRVRITSASRAVSCGTMIVGQSRTIGGTEYGARAGITDYSKKEADAFGNYQIVPRAYAKRQSLKIITDNTKIDGIYTMMADLRSTPCVWVGSDDYAATWSYGFWKDVVVEIAYVNQSVISLEIEGLA